MPTPRLDDALLEFNFTAQEKIAADLLPLLQIQRLQTRYAQLMKEKARELAPLKADDREWMCRMAELDGKMNMIQELFVNHQEAQKALSDPTTAAEFAMSGNTSVDELLAQQRAASTVHGPQT